MHILYWGTYDLGKARNEIIIQGLKEHGHRVSQCQEHVWRGFPDKGQVRAARERAIVLFRFLAAYPKLLFQLFRVPQIDLIIIGYMGLLDILILWPFARIMGIPIVLDAFLSIYNTVVEDRRMVREKSFLAILIYHWERFALSCAELVLVDTNEHAKYFKDTFGLAEDKLLAVYIGAREQFFCERDDRCWDGSDESPITILFFGTFIPLHGLETIYQAAEMTPRQIARWVIIGRGQESDRLDKLWLGMTQGRVERIYWQPDEEILKWIQRADICLGIFGDTEKASRVIPNKLYEVIAGGAPIITRDSPAIRELFDDQEDGIILVPCADPRALSEAVTAAYRSREMLRRKDFFSESKWSFRPRNTVLPLVDYLKQVPEKGLESNRSNTL